MPQSPLEVSYLFGSVVHYRPGEELQQRRLSDYELVLIYQGHPVYVHGEEEHQLSPGTLVLAQPECGEHWIWDDRDYTRHGYLHFNITSLPERWGNSKDWPLILSRPNPTCISIFGHLLERVSCHTDWPMQEPGTTSNTVRISRKPIPRRTK